MAGYVGDLVDSLVDAGCSVAVVSAGHVYTPSLLGGRQSVGRCRAEEIKPRGSVRRFQVMNSPILAPSLWQFGEPEAEITSRPVERAFRQVCQAFKPDIVHVHGFEGFGAGIVGVARRLGIKVVASIHNYHPFCPQVYLLRGRRRPCEDYDGGQACETCDTGIDIEAERRRRASGRGRPPSIKPPGRAPMITFAENGEPASESLGIEKLVHPLWTPIDDGLPDAEASKLVSGRYGQRRSAYAAALNQCAAVLAVSVATAEICIRMGVDEDRIIVDHIGSWAAAVPADRRPKAPESDTPLRLTFLGFGSYPKGLGILCDALLLLPREVRARVALSVHGPGIAEDMARLDAVQSDFAATHQGGPYTREDVVRLLDGLHAAVVPSVWHDNGPQTAIEARALGVPVIGSRIGGIPDIIADGVDGVLFRANDRADLARVIARLVSHPGDLGRLRSSIRPWITMSQHADSVLRVYERALLSRAGSGDTERV
ncbi:MAG: glycosyltransferase [Planctomycetota bacterium]